MGWFECFLDLDIWIMISVGHLFVTFLWIIYGMDIYSC